MQLVYREATLRPRLNIRTASGFPIAEAIRGAYNFCWSDQIYLLAKSYVEVVCISSSCLENLYLALAAAWSVKLCCRPPDDHLCYQLLELCVFPVSPVEGNTIVESLCRRQYHKLWSHHPLTRTAALLESFSPQPPASRDHLHLHSINPMTMFIYVYYFGLGEESQPIGKQITPHKLRH